MSNLKQSTGCVNRLRRFAIGVAVMVPGVLLSAPQRAAPPSCQPVAAVTKLPGLSEASGVAISRRQPGRLWTHNDSGQSELVALTDRGAVSGRVRLTGATIDDWEAVAVGACPTGSCLYVADIGDNEGSRRRITVHRLPEPDAGATSAAVRETFHATYPDRPQDAETLLVTPQGDMFVVTKGETAPIALYRFPRNPTPGSTARLEAVGKPRSADKAAPKERLTDGAVSPNGQWIVLRTHGALLFYTAPDFVAGNWREAGRVSLDGLAEPQGEGVAFLDNATIVVVGEGGGKSQPGTFARLTCTF